jgi:hypothetical protein
VCVTIPTYNNADVLDATVQSVLTQDYEQDKIILLFADFGSTDGTLEKILRYRREWAGVFDLRGRRIGRTMKADAVSMWALQAVPGRRFLLWPGDVVYPHCFKTAALWYRRAKRQRYPVTYIVGEADIREKDGAVRRQTPLFTKSCRLRAYTEDSYEYVKKGYRHTVLPFGRHYSIRRDKVHTMLNYDARWNTLAYAGFFTDVLYIDEPLGCLRVREPDDELDEILFSFEQILTMCRATKELPDSHVAGARFEPTCRAQLAQYALWRAFLLYERGQSKEAEDCFLMTRIISPPIAGEECRRRMETLLETGDTSSKLWLAGYFSREETPDKPKWPVGGMFTHMWQQTRQWFSGEKKSKFS